MSFEVNGQVFESQEDYEKNYVIADMNFEDYLESDELPKKKKRDNTVPTSMLDNRQMKWALGGALRASALIWGVISIGMILFVLFCVFVWFR